MTIPKNIKDDINQYCKLNNIENVESFIIKVLKSGFDIEKYGLLNDTTPKIIEKEIEKIVYRDIIKEVPVVEYVEVEIIKEIPIEIIKEIIVEKEIPVENGVIKEVIVEKEVIKEVIVEKEVIIENKEKQKALESTIQKLRNELNEKNKKIVELENVLTEIKTVYNKPAIFLNGSDLNKIIK
jgi:dynactin complex subunit